MRVEVTYRVTLKSVIDIGELHTDTPYFADMLKYQLEQGDFEGEDPMDYVIENIEDFD